MTDSQSTHSLQARLFAALSEGALAYDPERSILLGMHAVDATLRQGEPVEFVADQALRNAIWRSRLRLTIADALGAGFTCAAWSPDGTHLAIGAGSPDAPGIAVWDARTGERRWTSSGPLRGADYLRYSPDGTRMAVGGVVLIGLATPGIAILDATDGMLRRTLAVGAAVACAWSPDGTRLAVGTGDAFAVWDAETGTRLRSLGPPSGFGLAWSPDGTRIAACTNGVQVWDPETGKVLQTLGPPRTVHVVAWSPDSRLLAVASSVQDGGADEFCEIWDTTTGAKHPDRGELSRRGGILAWSPDGRRLAKKDASDVVTVFEVATGAASLRLAGHVPVGVPVDVSPDDLATFLAWSPDGARLATGRTTNGPTALAHGVANGTRTRSLGVKVWDVQAEGLHDGEEVLALRPGHAILDAAWSPDGARIAIAGRDGIDVIDARDGRRWRSFPPTPPSGGAAADGPGRYVAWSPDGVWLIEGGDAAPTRMWHVESGEELVTLDAVAVSSWSRPTWSSDGARLAAIYGGTHAAVWDLRTRRLLANVTEGEVARFALSADGTRLATASGQTAAIRIWDAEQGQLLATLGDSEAPDGLAWLADDRLLAISVATVDVWDVTRREKRLTFVTPKGYPLPSFASHPSQDRRFALSPDRTRLVLLAIHGGQTVNGLVGNAGAAPPLSVWDLETGQPLPLPAPLRVENFQPTDAFASPLVRWSPDGRQLAMVWPLVNRLYGEPVRRVWGDLVRSVRVTDTLTGREAVALSGVEIAGVAWRPDGKYLACWHDDRLDLHATDPAELLALARTRVTRNFTLDECLRYFDRDDPPAIP